MRFGRVFRPGFRLDIGADRDPLRATRFHPGGGKGRALRLIHDDVWGAVAHFFKHHHEIPAYDPERCEDAATKEKNGGDQVGKSRYDTVPVQQLPDKVTRAEAKGKNGK